VRGGQSAAPALRWCASRWKWELLAMAPLYHRKQMRLNAVSRHAKIQKNLMKHAAAKGKPGIVTALAQLRYRTRAIVGKVRGWFEGRAASRLEGHGSRKCCPDGEIRRITLLLVLRPIRRRSAQPLGKTVLHRNNAGSKPSFSYDSLTISCALPYCLLMAGSRMLFGKSRGRRQCESKRGKS